MTTHDKIRAFLAEAEAEVRASDHEPLYPHEAVGNAIRAVLRLHEPASRYDGTVHLHVNYCAGCGAQADVCPTVHEIARELELLDESDD